MTTFDETEHPRAGGGKFTDKRQTASEVRLERDLYRMKDLPEPFLSAAIARAEARQAGDVDGERDYQKWVSDQLEGFVLERFPRARAIQFHVDRDYPAGRPDVTAITRGSEELWNQDRLDDPELAQQIFAIGSQLVNPYFAPDDNARLREWRDEMLVLRGWEIRVKKR